MAHDHSICSYFFQVARIFLFIYVFYHIYLHYSQVQIFIPNASILFSQVQNIFEPSDTFSIPNYFTNR
jgi:hypothetical protein